MDDVDPSIIVPHDWQKLRTIWKALNADYKAALNRFTLSGTHDSDFYNFCFGKQDVYYLRKYLEVRPELTGTVEADLPDDVFVDSKKISPTKVFFALLLTIKQSVVVMLLVNWLNS